jgi:hypothetical protein
VPDLALPFSVFQSAVLTQLQRLANFLVHQAIHFRSRFAGTAHLLVSSAAVLISCVGAVHALLPSLCWLCVSFSFSLDSWFKLYFHGDFLNVVIRCSVKCLWRYKLFFDLIFIVDLARGLASTIVCFCYGF